MPKPDNEELTNPPSMVPDRDELASYQRQKQGKPRAKERDESSDESAPVRSGNALTYVIGVVALLAVGAAGYLFTQLQASQELIAALEQRLSSTDESVNQSSGALQVKINEVSDALTQVRDETLKKYKAQIDQQGSQIATLDKSLKNAQGTLSEAAKNIAEGTKLIEGLRSDVNKYSAVADQAKQKADQHQSILDSLSSKIKAVGDAQAKLDARLSNNEEWVDSINTFRKQMNREIVNIKQQIAGGKPPAPPADVQ